MDQGADMEGWIQRLESGELTMLRMVYCVLVTENEILIRHAGEAIRGQLSCLSRVQLLRVCERFRTFTSLEWFIDWSSVSPKLMKKDLPEDTFQYVLILGSFHPNGYFREKCMYAMAELPGMLFWLLPRLNDWVLPVREGAGRILESYLKSCDERELVAALPAVERLRDCRRRTEDQLQSLETHIRERLAQCMKEITFAKIPYMEPALRASLYRIATEAGLWTIGQMEFCLNQEKLSCLKRILIRRILAHSDCTLEWAKHYLQDSSSQVRRMALEFRYESLKRSWPGLEEMLLDSSRGIREYAAYILERHGNLDIRGYYLEHLEQERHGYAILGLTEYSRQGNVQELLKCLDSPEHRILRSALVALGSQEDFTDEELLWNYILDDRKDIAKAAYLSIRKRGFRAGAKRIGHALEHARTENQKRYLLNLLLRENSWERLPWLLRLYQEDMPEQEKNLVLSGIGFRSMYGHVAEPLRKEILSALEEGKGKFPERIEKGILYDMKFL